jgi:hypothetical protein
VVHGGLCCWYHFLLQSLYIRIHVSSGLIDIMYLCLRRIGMCYMLEYDACQVEGVCGLVGWVGVRFDICSCNRIYISKTNKHM